MKKDKTYKREVALAILGGFGYVVFTNDVQMAEVLVWPTFTFAALSFGLDWWGKAGSVHRPFNPSGVQHSTSRSFDRRGSECSSEHSDWEGEHPDRRAG
jgi:hypothetical protein